MTYSNNDRHRLTNAQADNMLTKQTKFGRIADQLSEGDDTNTETKPTTRRKLSDIIADLEA